MIMRGVWRSSSFSFFFGIFLGICVSPYCSAGSTINVLIISSDPESVPAWFGKSIDYCYFDDGHGYWSICVLKSLIFPA